MKVSACVSHLIGDRDGSEYAFDLGLLTFENTDVVLCRPWRVNLDWNDGLANIYSGGLSGQQVTAADGESA